MNPARAAARVLPWLLPWMLAAVLAGCSSTPAKPPVVERAPVPVGAAPLPATATPPPPSPAAMDAIPDAVPRFEPRSTRGNPVAYEVFGKRYFVLGTADGYRERGVASWYGPTFHARPTSSGEPYDMYAMTAAHKTLPIPAYVRVTNLSNGRSIVVRVNDRGPFVANRIIDLSYTAAYKLDMTRAGTAFVEVEVITPGTLAEAAQGVAPQPPPTLQGPVLYLQAGAFGVADNANQLAGRLRREGIESVRVVEPDAGSNLFRVRVGPIADVATFDSTAQRIERLGVATRLISE
ncbi:MAG: septal ring lytic transglycosylase RlpA family protein [Pseudomonadota bacterium]